MRSFARALVLCVGAILAVVTFPLAGFAQGFSDDFEASTFDPFWTLVQQNGTIALSTDQSVSGIQSAKLTSVSGGQRNIWLTHTFPQATQGTLSVWWYDTLGNLYSGLYAFNSTTGVQTSVGVYDNSAPFYVFNVGGGGTYTTIGRTAGWHQLTIQVAATGIIEFIDGNQVGAADGDFSFDELRLLVSGPSFDPDATFYFDDFSLYLLGSL